MKTTNQSRFREELKELFVSQFREIKIVELGEYDRQIEELESMSSVGPDEREKWAPTLEATVRWRAESEPMFDSFIERAEQAKTIHDLMEITFELMKWNQGDDSEGFDVGMRLIAGFLEESDNE